MSEIIEERKEKLAGFFKKKTVWIIIGLFFLFFLAWHIRTSNVPSLKDITNNEYTLGPDLDPFLFLRYAKIINEQGSLPAIDSFRYVPLGYKTAEETKLLPYMIAYFHKMFSVFSGKSIEYSAVMFPVLMFLITIAAFFLLIREIFSENKYKNSIAFISSLFLIVSPSLLARTVAGIPEKESAGFFFLFAALYLFLAGWKNQGAKKSLMLGILAGLSTGLMGLVWGGWIYIFITIALFAFIGFIFGEADKKRFFCYTAWMIVSLAVPILFSARFSLKGLISSPTVGISAVVFLFMLTDTLIFNTKAKENKFVASMQRKLPDKAISIIFAVVIGLVISVPFFGISFVPRVISDVIEHLTQPYFDRLSFTVAENRQPYFDEWKGNFGPTQINFFGKLVTTPPLFFWLFFAGSIALFYEFVKNLEKREKIILITLYVLFLFGLIFSRYSASSILNGTSFISSLLYFGSFVLLILAFTQIFYKYYKENRLEELKKLNYSYLFLLMYFIPGLMGARSAIRLLMGLAPSAVGLIGFLCVYVYEKAKNSKEERKTIFYAAAVIIILLSTYCFYANYQSSLAGAKSMVPSIYTQQWQKAMEWVRNNTAKDAVFSHWWDYGYWIQSIGERATVLDGGNSIAYWDHLLGRHVLTAASENEALEFLYAHNASYLLIDSTDIGKYGAYSRIGSDENYDRYSWIGNFQLNDQSIQERKNDTVYFYQGGVTLDEDYIYEEEGKKVLLPSGGTGVGAFLLTQSKSNASDFEQPTAIFVYNGKQNNIPMRYLYYDNKLYDFNSGYKGCVYIIPRVVGTSNGNTISLMGSALFLSERNMRALWVRLYLLGQGENFKLVHSEPDFIVSSAGSQFKINDFLIYNDIRGPIKIWKINYPENIKLNPEYLSTSYPDSVRLDTLAG